MALLFEGGEFTAADAARSGSCMAAYAPTLLFQTAVLLLARADYARGNQRRPVIVSAIAVGVNVALDFALVIPYGATGIAAATSIATLVNAGLLAWGLKLGDFEVKRELVLPLLRVLAAALVMLAAVFLTRLALARLDVPDWQSVAGMRLPLRSALTVGAGMVVGLAAFFGAARLLCRAELDELMGLLHRRRARRTDPPAVR
jgi:putative peptidoglycan lipid II flippase